MKRGGGRTRGRWKGKVDVGGGGDGESRRRREERRAGRRDGGGEGKEGVIPVVALHGTTHTDLDMAFKLGQAISMAGLRAHTGT